MERKIPVYSWDDVSLFMENENETNKESKLKFYVLKKERERRGERGEGRECLTFLGHQVEEEFCPSTRRSCCCCCCCCCYG